ncbi:BTAD domain-containing putative transcriptional regulator, partial [Streptomyces sp. IB201691-2A2]|uniref:AfsR/SARP family transcriptional regulator n=1 Tax=Streptomyces sp. IB201691-2A2 TaxID=2561920 RepID=UPI001181136C
MNSSREPIAGDSLRVSILGPLRAWRLGKELVLGPPKQQSVLALLVVQAGHPVPLRQIVDALWIEKPPERAVNVVHRHVGSLRRLLEPGLARRSDARLLVRTASGYRLNLGVENLDLLQFRKMRDSAQRAAAVGQPDEAADLFIKALSLWRGRVAAGLFDFFGEHTIFRGVDSEYFHAAQAAAESSLLAGRTRDLLPLIKRAAHDDPLNEALQASLIRVLASEGRAAEALDHYQSVRSQLADDLGIDPGTELRNAHAEVLRSAPDSDLEDTRGEAASQTGFGRNLPGVRPAQLPPNLRVFTGRQKEISRLDEPFLSADGNQHAATVSVISGAPGVGKTTLALHWAHRNASRYPDGQLYINLRGYDSSGDPLTPSVAVCYLLESLGVPNKQMPPGFDSQVALYRSLLAQRQCLILLDNARNAEQVRPLLPGNPACVTVITSRERMTGLVASAGAHLLNLETPTIEEAFDFLSRRLGRSRIEAERGAALSIIEQCGRLPLALAIVCARVQSFPAASLAAVAEELHEGRDTLQSLTLDGEIDPATDANSVFSWSYRALTDDAALAFRRLWLSPAHSVSLHAAASLTGMTMKSTRQIMAELHRASLWNEHRSGYYSSHDLLRVFGRKVADVQDSPQLITAARGRLYDHYLHTSSSASRMLNSHREHPDLPDVIIGTQVRSFNNTEYAANWFHHEMPALQEIVTHAENELSGAYAWRMAAILELVLDRSGRRQEQIVLQSSALKAAQRADDIDGQAHMHRSLGFALGRSGESGQSEEHLSQAIVMFSQSGDLLGEALTHRYIAFFKNVDERHHEALDEYEKAKCLYERSSHPVGLASVANEVGWTRILLGDYKGAIDNCRHAIEISRKVGNPNVEAASWDSIGVAYHNLGMIGQSVDALNRALSYYRELNDAYLTADTLIHIGDAYLRQNPEEANRAWREALEILESLGHPERDEIRKRLQDSFISD